MAFCQSTPFYGQPSFGIRSTEAPNEDRYVYKALPDVVIQTVATAGVRLSTVWRDRPVLLTMIFTRCAGVCSPFLRSLKGTAADAEGLGRDYRIVVLSFDPQDPAADMDRMGESLGVKSDPAWIFGVASPSDIRRLAAAVGFWFYWDPSLEQYDHPSLVIAVDRERVVRMLAGAEVPSPSLREVAQELRGKFVSSHALAGKVAFRYFEYDPNRGRYGLDSGILLMLLPATCALLSVAWAFSPISRCAGPPGCRRRRAPTSCRTPKFSPSQNPFPPLCPFRD
jgi:cytochrome oxidase Cu insertion factor (SCO1/SenC/PrrC family)